MEKAERIPDIFASRVFSEDVMRERLPKDVYKSLLKTIATGKEIDAGIADVVAGAMKDWAIEKGATHFTHWKNDQEHRILEIKRTVKVLDLESLLVSIVILAKIYYQDVRNITTLLPDVYNDIHK